MEFEDLQIIWNSQENEKMFAVDETALFAHIKRKSRSIERKLDFVELIMVTVNLGVGILLLVDSLGSDQRLRFIIPIMYLAYAVYAVARRRARRQEEVSFEPTLRGELDKAIWRVDYLIRQGRSMVIWYLLPLMLAATIFMVINDRLVWALGLLLVVIPLTYFGGRWEIRKFYLPRKRTLEDLRKALLASQVD